MSKICFVVMGFGKKTDYPTGRNLDLDATYEAIIEPAVTGSGMTCVRADKVITSGLIDAPMYEMLYRADLVIADISTDNVNAVYELGVRHALRPRSTILMREKGGKLQFDLNHVSTFFYEHLGPDIGSREARRAVRDLSAMIATAMAEPRDDSPVYTFLPDLARPAFSNEDYERLVEGIKTAGDDLATLVAEGKKAMRENRFDTAERAFAEAMKRGPNETFIAQQLALAIYKRKFPTPIEALARALDAINELKPSESTDPETLGIAGAIHKNLFMVTKEVAHLDVAIELYGRGYVIRRDYYNGENLALCHDYRAGIVADEKDRVYHRVAARLARLSIVKSLEAEVNSPAFEERGDRKWVFATLANCHFALGKPDDGKKYENRFFAENPADWEKDTYMTSKSVVVSISEISR